MLEAALKHQSLKNYSETLVTVGVDTHLDEHVAVALDHLGRRLDVLCVATNEGGYSKFLGWAHPGMGP